MKRRLSFGVIFIVLSLSACNGAGEDGDDTDHSGNNSDAEALTLDTCSTTISEDAPEFYQRYFRCVTITMEDGDVRIVSNGLPPHLCPYYPEDDPNWTDFDTRGGTYHQNPNEINEQDISMLIPANPVSKGLEVDESMVDKEAGTSDDEYRGGVPGMGLDSVPFFHGVAAPGDDIDEEQFTFDTYEGHPQSTGMYHHHSESQGPLAVLEDMGLVTSTDPGSAEIELFGIMCDGTLLLGCTELNGETPDDSDFDAQNGHVHDIVDEEGVTHFSDRYHTHLCSALYDHIYAPEIQYYDSCETSDF